MSNVVLRNGKHIGEGFPCYVLMDVAANHNGSLETAKELVRKAAEAGADAVKFQTYTADKLYSKNTPQFSRDPVKPYDLIRQVQHPREWLPVLSAFSKQCGIDFLSSPFDQEAVDLLDRLDVPFFKIASPEIVDLELIRYVAGKGRPVVISTGMSNLGEVEDAVRAAADTGNRDIILLQCSTRYPSPAHIVNLNAMETMRRAFRLPVGYSDHTLGRHIALAAVAKGACMIEKHFTLDRNQKGPDHSFAMEPDELRSMVKEIREIEQAAGDGVKKVTPEEMENHEKGRRSIIAARHIPKGTVITKEMLTVKRPGYGIKPKLMDLVEGRRARVDIAEDDILTWDMVL